MTEDPEGHEEREAPKRPRVSRWAVLRSVGWTILGLALVGGVLGAIVALFHPDSPLPREWNPTVPLAVSDPVTPLTMWKLRAAVSDPAQCVAVLQTGAMAQPRTPRVESDTCHIRNRVSVSQLDDGTNIAPVLSETSCATALRMAMWTRHGLQPAAREIVGSEVRTIRQNGSYNCRRIRSSTGATNRWSTHATADAVDVIGFDLADGRRVRLIADWEGETPEALFLRSARDSACTWFATTLGPDYNALHADHFHLQARGWGACR